MHSTPQKTALIKTLLELVPVWDFAEFLVHTISGRDFSDEEIDDLHDIVRSAVDSVERENSARRIKELLKEEKIQSEKEITSLSSLLHLL